MFNIYIYYKKIISFSCIWVYVQISYRGQLLGETLKCRYLEAEQKFRNHFDLTTLGQCRDFSSSTSQDLNPILLELINEAHFMFLYV